MTTDIAVIGGGASGLMAALCARRYAGNVGVTVLERMARVGKKLMATGNGRCNLTNERAREGGYHGGCAEIAAKVFERFSPDEIIRFFESIGVQPRVEGEGRVYPMSEQASSVLDALRLSLSEAGGGVSCDFEVCKINQTMSGKFMVIAADGRVVHAHRVIMATGGLTAPNLGGSDSGLRLLQSMGHQIVEPLPALVQIRTETRPIRPLKGIKAEMGAALEVDGRIVRREYGEVLFTEYGLSGPAILQLSRGAAQAVAAGREAAVVLSVLPYDREQTAALIKTRMCNIPERVMDEFLTGLVNKRLGQTMIKLALGFEGAVMTTKRAGMLREKQIDALAGILTEWRLPVTGTLGFEQAQVTAGGICAGEFDPDTMESRRVQGLYLAGELIDVDGDCGGYNLQWAWASGMLAGQSCAQSLEKVVRR